MRKNNSRAVRPLARFSRKQNLDNTFELVFFWHVSRELSGWMFFTDRKIKSPPGEGGERGDVLLRILAWPTSRGNLSTG